MSNKEPDSLSTLISPYVENPYGMIDLFCGIGGFSEGARRVGFKVAGLDNDHTAVHLYRTNVGQAAVVNVLHDGHPPFPSPFVFADLPILWCRGGGTNVLPLNHQINGFSSEEVVHTFRIAREASAEVVGFSWSVLGKIQLLGGFRAQNRRLRPPKTLLWLENMARAAGYRGIISFPINMADYGIPHLRRRYIAFCFPTVALARKFRPPQFTHGFPGSPWITVEDILPHIPYPFPCPAITAQEYKSKRSQGNRKAIWASSLLIDHVGNEAWGRSFPGLTHQEIAMIQGLPESWLLSEPDKYDPRESSELVSRAFSPVVATAICSSVMDYVRLRYNEVVRRKRRG